MRFLFVDSVLELAHARRVLTEFRVAPDEPVFARHFPANPMLPASMLIESFAQSGTILLEASSGFARKALPISLRNVKFRRAVRPGVTLRVEIDVEQWSEEGAMLRGLATECGTRTASCDFTMWTAPLQDFYRPADAAQYRAMYEQWFRGTAFEGFPRAPIEALRDALGR